MKTLHLGDQVHETVTKLKFINSMFCAWNVDEIPINVDDLAGLQLFMDDIIEEVESYGEVICSTSLPNTP